ncbi:MAG TPA: hydrolase, partial [Bacteroidota bacterium]|nr:hydrolase [Bacteroidota bacterium]
WRGTANLTAIAGPTWYFDEGPVSSIFQYSGFQVTYEHDDLYTDWSGALGLNMQFRSNWGFEVTLIAGESKDLGAKYTYYEGDLSSWFNLSPRWNANAWGGIARSYNFSRDYVGLYSWFGSYAEWKALDILELGTTYEMYIEGNPEGRVEDVTYNARPFVSLTPVNNLNLRLYVDNVFLQSSDQMERIIVGFLFSYNFLPKSWIYVALNEVREKQDVLNAARVPIGRRMETADRVGVMKVKYLYYL